MKNKRETALYIFLALSVTVLVTAAVPVKLHDDTSKTTAIRTDMTCAMCGETNEFQMMASSSQSGYNDLDMRPGPVRRFSMWLWIKRCPNCGYCTHDLEIVTDEEAAREILESEAYIAQLNNKNYPELANSFLCHSMFQVANGEYCAAAGSCQTAAWVCDDEEGFEDQAVECRLRSIELYETAFDEDEPDINAETVTCIMVDMLRRVGKFDEARDLCEETLDGYISEKIIQGLLEFELELIDAEDIDAHTLGEIPNVEDLFD